MKSSKQVLENKMEIIERNLDFLDGKKEKFKPQSADYEEIQAIKHSLQETIETCLDIANHIISSEGFERPENYSQFFKLLAKEDIIKEPLSKRLTEMAKFRNFLVHQYEKVDNEELLNIIKKDLEDVEDFVKEIYNYIKN